MLRTLFQCATSVLEIKVSTPQHLLQQYCYNPTDDEACAAAAFVIMTGAYYKAVKNIHIFAGRFVVSWLNEWLCILYPVSYTHLDVYKRQEHNVLCDCHNNIFKNYLTKNMRHLVICIPITSKHFYTHTSKTLCFELNVLLCLFLLEHKFNV